MKNKRAKRRKIKRRRFHNAEAAVKRRSHRKAKAATL